MTFPGLEMTILKFHDFSRFSMTVRTMKKVGPELGHVHPRVGWGGLKGPVNHLQRPDLLFTVYSHRTCLPLTKSMNHPPHTHPPTFP